MPSRELAEWIALAGIDHEDQLRAGMEARVSAQTR